MVAGSKWGLTEYCSSYYSAVSLFFGCFHLALYLKQNDNLHVHVIIPLFEEYHLLGYKYSACHLLAHWFFAELISLTLKIEAICSSETSVDTQRTTRRYIPEDGTLHNHRCENLKSIYLFSRLCQLYFLQCSEKSADKCCIMCKISLISWAWNTAHLFIKIYIS
jgi:hypothetical protein